MANTEKLRDMLDHLIDDKNEQAQVDFHEFLGDKMKDVIADMAVTNNDKGRE